MVTLLTFPKGVGILLVRLAHPVSHLQVVQPEVGELQDEPRVNYAVRRLEIPVCFELAAVQVRHPLETKESNNATVISRKYTANPCM
jgi:hypothetical protein